MNKIWDSSAVMRIPEKKNNIDERMCDAEQSKQRMKITRFPSEVQRFQEFPVKGNIIFRDSL